MALAVFDLFREALSEFLATCCFVFLMCGTGLSTRDPSDAIGLDLTAHFAVSLANGLAATTVIYMFGSVSGAHFNPVVSVCLWAIGKLGTLRMVLYFAAQMAGGIFGAALLMGVFPSNPIAYPNQGGLGHTDLTADVTKANGWMCETLITFTLVFTAMRVAVDPVNFGKFAPLLIGGVIFVNVMIGVTISGGSMNPARSFGPAVVSGMWNNHWVYWVGPFMGGILATLVYTQLFVSKEQAKPYQKFDNPNESQSLEMDNIETSHD